MAGGVLGMAQVGVALGVGGGLGLVVFACWLGTAELMQRVFAGVMFPLVAAAHTVVPVHILPA